MAITQNTYTGNGSTVLYSFTFPYIDSADVKVTLNGTLTTAYIFANATTIQFTTAPTAGVAIRIYRETYNDEASATFFPGSSIKASDLNNNFTQTLYVVQEVVSRYISKIGDTMQGILNMGGFKITNLGAPTLGTDATTKTYVDTQDALKVNKAGDTMSGNLAMGGNKVTGLGTPTVSTDAATRGYVDGVALAGTVPDGDRGDITVSNTGTVWSIDNGAIVEAKLGTGAVTSTKILDGTIVDADVNANADIASSKLSFTQAGTGAAARTIDSKLKDVINVKDFGAVGDGVVDDTAAIQAAINAYTNNAVIDFGGKTYRITSAITVNNSSLLTLQNGTLSQATEAANVLQIAGNYCARLTLENFNLRHTFNSASAGNCFDVAVTNSNFNFFRWVGGITQNGFYGIRTRGAMWMAHFERIWVLSPRSSGFYIPASGSVVDAQQLGGSTTTKLYKCFVTDVQTAAPAYAIGTGFDTLILEHCSADRCSQFGFFKASPLRIESCSMEAIKNPPVGSISGPHTLINLGSGSGATIDGFHMVFDGTFVAPTPPGGTVNSFLYALNSNNLTLTGVRGGLPAGYFTLNQEGGKAFVNTQLLGSGIRSISGGIARTVDDISTTNRTALFGTTNGNSAPTTLWNFESGDNSYILYTTYAFSGSYTSSVWLVSTSTSQSKGIVAKLMSGPDYSTSITISIVGTTVQYSTVQNLFSGWQAFKLNLKDY